MTTLFAYHRIHKHGNFAGSSYYTTKENVKSGDIIYVISGDKPPEMRGRVKYYLEGRYIVSSIDFERAKRKLILEAEISARPRISMDIQEWFDGNEFRNLYASGPNLNPVRPEYVERFDALLMNGEGLDGQLIEAAKLLRQELADLGVLSFAHRLGSSETDTGGRYTVVAIFSENLEIQLWLDKAAGSDIYRFWFGFFSNSSNDIDALIGDVPLHLRPNRRLTRADWITNIDDALMLKNPDIVSLTRPFLEDYGSDGCFFGMYDWGGHASRGGLHLDTWRAGQFIREVVQPKQYDAIDDIGWDLPHAFSSTRWNYRRDPKVRDRVMKRANGKCEFCGQEGFLRDDGSQYLESHHIIALADDGADRLTNVIALCPSHHREAHSGKRRKELEAEMIEVVQSLTTKIVL